MRMMQFDDERTGDERLKTDYQEVFWGVGEIFLTNCRARFSQMSMETAMRSQCLSETDANF